MPGGFGGVSAGFHSQLGFSVADSSSLWMQLDAHTSFRIIAARSNHNPCAVWQTKSENFSSAYGISDFIFKPCIGGLENRWITESYSPPRRCTCILPLPKSGFTTAGFLRERSKIAVKRALIKFAKRKQKFPVVRAEVQLAGGLDVINNLGLDTLTFLAATVLVIPAFKAINASPILGFLLSGVVLNQLGLIRNVMDIKALSELGILFLLFEMGLELSLARLKALARFAFGMGLAQVFFSTLAFTAFELPPNGAIGTKMLEFLFHSRPDLVNIRTVDEAVVIGAGLSLSSSAFVLQLLAEKGELPTRFGSATLGVLLLQDIAVVPLLVILPILESGNLSEESLWPVLAAESLKALGGLGALSLGGQLLLRRIFEIVANSRSSEAFVALCLLTVTGTSLLTQKLGFSDTLGAFLAGALLAETNYRTQVEADIRPFRGLLLGLFFVTTGTSIDIQLLLREWPNVLALLGGLIAIKTAIITAIGPRVGLTLPESVRIGLLLSQGGEFAFVVFSLANRLGVLPLELNRLLIIVVVLSMALTPFLNEVGRKAAEELEARAEHSQAAAVETMKNSDGVNEPVVIIGFGQMGQVLANFLSTPLASGLGGGAGGGWPYVAFDLNPGRVKAACKLGFPVLYGDGSLPVVLQTAGISTPKAIMVMYTGRKQAVQAVERLRLAFPGVPIYARAQDLGHLLELKNAGATDAILENAETSLQLGSVLLQGLGVMSEDVAFLKHMIRESMELRAKEALLKKESKETDWLMPFEERVSKTWKNRSREGQSGAIAVYDKSHNKKDHLGEPALQPLNSMQKLERALEEPPPRASNGAINKLGEDKLQFSNEASVAAASLEGNQLQPEEPLDVRETQSNFEDASCDSRALTSTSTETHGEDETGVTFGTLTDESRQDQWEQGGTLQR
ncbi:hypothetical protein O6H91_06G120000 [Diphasiastrum complanatum]|uniref:Uncharacterized protein n=1 Tax=Diphasiastrum complanatum TaxID=34168 RepID=A0ACC2DI87_DIPCM|nr:hypothetical protein O6H91_06G120000 [Diphasiastrum complanatum]